MEDGRRRVRAARGALKGALGRPLKTMSIPPDIKCRGSNYTPEGNWFWQKYVAGINSAGAASRSSV